MNISTLIGKKIEQTQAFLEDGTRVPLTRVWVGENSVTQIKNSEKDGYMALQVAFGERNKISKPLSGHLKKAGLKNKPRFLREIRIDDVAEFEAGQVIKSEEVLEAGDKVDVIGVSKGKGFAGAVKRWGFKGGPKTHGQSDRHRAPGSIGQSTTPGRVYKGKRMAGNMGHDRVTVKNLEVAEVKDGEILIRGLIPGPKGGVIMITKIGVNKKFKPLYKSSSDSAEAESNIEQANETVVENEVKVEESVIEETILESREPEATVEEVKAEEAVADEAPVETTEAASEVAEPKVEEKTEEVKETK